jgi:hypothetical protein
MSPNVPAVYDVLAARIEKCVAFLGPTKCGGVLAWEWSVCSCPYYTIIKKYTLK